MGLDSSVEMIEMARRRLKAHAHKVELEVTDLWRWKPDGVWDCAVACFFVEHVPDELLRGNRSMVGGADAGRC